MMGITGNYGPGTPLSIIIDHIKKAAYKKWELELKERENKN